MTIGWLTETRAPRRNVFAVRVRAVHTADPTQPPTVTPTLPVTGGDASGLWWLFGTGAALIVTGTAARLILRRSRASLHA
ncbi:hypothetical protein [Micromonospora sp. NPDC049301]|uniref:hypothetical protein n=1 Tax=Micromonospora sp. NPDC049301 TaxID=3155723 RepID=UPI0034412785